MDGGPNHDTVGVTHLPVASAAARAEAEDIVAAYERSGNAHHPRTTTGLHPSKAMDAASPEVRRLALHLAMRRMAAMLADSVAADPDQPPHPDHGPTAYEYLTLYYMIERGVRERWLITDADCHALIEWWDTALPAERQEQSLPMMLAYLSHRHPKADATVAAWCERALDVEGTSTVPSNTLRSALLTELARAGPTQPEKPPVGTVTRTECSAKEIAAVKALARAFIDAAMKRDDYFSEPETLPQWKAAAALARQRQRVLALELGARFPAIAQRVRAAAAELVKKQLSRERVVETDLRGIAEWWSVGRGYPDLVACSAMLKRLLAKDLEFSHDEWVRFLGDLSSFDYICVVRDRHGYMNALMRRLERAAPSLGTASNVLPLAVELLAKRVGECAANAAQQRAEARLNAIAAKLREHAVPTPSTPPLAPPAPSKRAITLVDALRAIPPTASGETPESHPAIQELWSSPPALRREACCLAMTFVPKAYKEYQASSRAEKSLAQNPHYFTFLLLNDLIERSLTREKGWSLPELQQMFAWWHDGCRGNHRFRVGRTIATIIEREGVQKDDHVRAWAQACLNLVLSSNSPIAKEINRLRAIIGEAPRFRAVTGEVWSEAAGADITKSPAATAWVGLLEHASTASGPDPSKAWCKAALEHLKAIKHGVFTEMLEHWLPLMDKPRTTTLREGSYSEYREGSLVLTERSQLQLKGLCWMMGLVAADPSAARSSRRPDLSRLLGRTAISAYRKVPGLGPRATKVGNAAVLALGMIPGMDSLGQLSLLRIKVKFGSAQKMIEKALLAAAAREKLPREEIDELSVPSYGLTDVGILEEVLGETKPANQITASLIVAGVGDVELRFSKGGKALKSIPAAVKAEHANTLKELKATQQDLAAMIGAQRDRLDSLFLENKTWDYAIWRERYLDHPVVGVLARRLIWRVRTSASAPWRSVTHLVKLGLCDVQGRPVEIVEQGAQVRLWHPIEVDAAEALAWRRFFEDRELRQPFKQAHREIYLLTDAERRTGTYSNRYAAHIIKQHQFNALALVRGWKNKLRLLVDAEYPPASRTLNAFALRAEFWIEGMGDDFGEDTNEAGVFKHLATDQVRFSAIDVATTGARAGGHHRDHLDIEINHPIPLDRIPPLAFSEIMRDVDLFVGVCSVGNNAQWQDGGPEGAFRDYWWEYGFGELTQSGNQRRELLERLIPRLAIAPRCSFSGKFLVVKGDLRTYKVHLGSGNILMEPDGQYLCIVPGTPRGADPMTRFLPFEGDRILSIILSKAMMLAADTKITDTSIMWQIRGR
jgi:hypothetical protein